jgi:signal transduction histidine kinase
LATLFIKNISQRLNILVENARRLPKRQELAKTVGGRDELSYLDEAMHTAATDLQAAFEFRTSLMQMVAHDLRSPLQASQISLAILTDFEATNVSAGALAQIERVKANNQRLISLVNDLLTLDSLELGRLELHKEQTTAKEVAQDAIDTLSQVAAVRKIELQNLATDATIFVDKQKISQVLINYITNAIKFSPSNSVIKIGSDSRKDLVRLFVRDQGPGLSLEEAERVFEKFFQAKEGKNAGGFGLGLAICRLIVESHGGDVGVFSEKGDGAEFWFRVKAKSKSALELEEEEFASD